MKTRGSSAAAGIDERSKVRDGGRADLASTPQLSRVRSCEGGSIAGLAERGTWNSFEF
jgi:hypothetical protein